MRAAFFADHKLALALACDGQERARMTSKRHTAEEIGAKLHQAEEMTRQGKLQGEIARALGISVMTYHRWRKAHHSLRGSPMVTPSTTGHSNSTHEDSLTRLGDLELENSRLRRLVTDLLLEKMKLEEDLSVRGHSKLPKQARWPAVR
jgi:putative transposase